MERLTGIGVSAGVAVGPAMVAVQRTQVLRFPIGADRVPREVDALERARARSREQLTQIRTRIAGSRASDLAAIFDAQILMLDDPMLVERATAIIREQRVNAEWAVQRAFDEVAAVFSEVDDPYLRERKGDIHDIAGRLRMNLHDEKGSARDVLRELEGPCVLIADELTPSILAQLDWTWIRGFATDAGSRTYHTAILARSLGVPAVVGLHDASRRVPVGAIVVLDGDSGEVIVDPTPRVRRDAESRARAPREQVTVPATEAPLRTIDGVRIVLQANVERPADGQAARRAGAEGIGLYRSEFLLGGGPPDLASEDEQHHVYRQLVEDMAPLPVSIRTFDVDEHQLNRPLVDSALGARWFPEWDERPGHSGLRGIRFGLAHPAIFKTQLRALLRAAASGHLRIVFPFVSSVYEVRQARALIDTAREELRARGIEPPPVPIGIMIEVPSAAFMAPQLAREVDFFAIGTNDLIQYTLAVDRTDDRVSNRYEPLHPAVIRLLRHVRRAAARHGIPVSVCGEMASDPLLLRLLIGCGLTDFSMTPGALSLARRVVEQTSAAEMVHIAAHVLTLGTVEEIEGFLGEAFSRDLRNEVHTR